MSESAGAERGGLAGPGGPVDWAIIEERSVEGEPRVTRVDCELDADSMGV